MIYWLEYGLGAATILFYLAYFMGRKHIQPWHIVCAIFATVITVGIGLWLIISVNIIYTGDRAAAGIVAESYATGWMILAHRILATVVFIAMLYQAFLGFTKKMGRHRLIAPYFIVGFTVVYISGMLLFRGT